MMLREILTKKLLKRQNEQEKNEQDNSSSDDEEEDEEEEERNRETSDIQRVRSECLKRKAREARRPSLGSLLVAKLI